MTIGVSLSEAEALARKATRGAGYSWGMAEEAGRAVRWLSGYRLPGLDCLARVLTVGKGSDALNRALLTHPTVATDGSWHWTAGDEALCALCAGVALMDRGHQLQAGARLTLARVREPLFLLPFIAMTATALDMNLLLSARKHRMVCRAGGGLCGQVQPWCVSALNDVTLSSIAAQAVHAFTQALPEPQEPAASAMTAKVDPIAWRELDRLAHRTYVPSSAESRASAGSGTTDND